MQIKIELGNGETCTLDEETSERIAAVARKRHRSVRQIVILAISQRLKELRRRQPAAVAGIIAGMREKERQESTGPCLKVAEGE